MSELIRDYGIVLRTIPFGETSLIVTAFSVKHGKIGLLAKGALRKVKAGTALILEPGYELEFVWVHKDSRELQLVREMSLVNAHFGIRSSLEATIIASAALELLLRTSSEDDPHPPLYDAISRLLSLCETRSTARWPLYWKFHLVLLSQLGFAVGEPTALAKYPFKLAGESLAMLRKLENSSFDLASRMRTSATAEQEITRWLTLYLSDHLHISAQSRSFDALYWARVSS